MKQLGYFAEVFLGPRVPRAPKGPYRSPQIGGWSVGRGNESRGPWPPPVLDKMDLVLDGASSSLSRTLKAFGQYFIYIVRNLIFKLYFG